MLNRVGAPSIVAWLYVHPMRLLRIRHPVLRRGHYCIDRRERLRHFAQSHRLGLDTYLEAFPDRVEDGRQIVHAGITFG